MISLLCRIPEPFEIELVLSFTQHWLVFSLSTICPSAPSFQKFITIVSFSIFLIAGVLPLKILYSKKILYSIVLEVFNRREEVGWKLDVHIHLAIFIRKLLLITSLTQNFLEF